jgi:arylsulfatase A-like enzyme
LHPPLFKDADREIEKMAYTRANYARGAVDLVGLMTKFLAELKRIGAFDNSLVFIIGDHGPGSRGLQAIHLQALGNSHAHEIQDEALKVIKAGALPLILVKPFCMPGTRPLAVSDSPAWRTNFPDARCSSSERRKSAAAATCFTGGRARPTTVTWAP